MKKRVIAFFLCAVLVLSAAGCRKQEDTVDSQVSSGMAGTATASGEGQDAEKLAGEIFQEPEETAWEPVSMEKETAKPEKPEKNADSIGNETTKGNSQTAGTTDTVEEGSRTAGTTDTVKEGSRTTGTADTVKDTPQTAGEKTPESGAVPKTATPPKTALPAATKPVQSPSKAEQPHTCTWDSGRVTTAAGCGSEGIRTYTCTGCGKTRTESIAKTGHNYVTETFPATCTRGVRTVTACSICGDVQSETYSGGPLCHLWEKTYWPEAPTCRNGGYYYQTCSRCGEKGESGTDPALPHTQVATEICHGNCVDVTVVEYTCSSCGANLGRDVHTEPNDHDWQQVSYEELNLITGEWETKTVTACSRCHTPQ